MKTLRNGNSRGHTLIELMVAIAIIGALVSIAIPQYSSHREKALAAHCMVNRYSLRNEEREYFLLNDQPRLQTEPYECPTGGIYVWFVSDPEEPHYPKIVCSFHGGALLPEPPEPKAPEEPLTKLGSTFDEITAGFIGRIDTFLTTNGRHPRGWGAYSFTDIGLDPEQWNREYDGIIYSPVGNRLNVRPAEGFVFTVTDSSRTVRELPWTYNWNLVYSMKDEQWYFHSMAKKNKIDISTLVVTERE